AALGAACACRADITIGGNARGFAMGGAGIAIVDRSERNTLLNPAALALLNRRTRPDYPTIGLRASGISLSAAFNHLFTHPDQNDAVSLARDFGKNNSEFGVSTGAGMRFGHIEATAWGLGTVRVLPNAAMQTWSR